MTELKQDKSNCFADTKAVVMDRNRYVIAELDAETEITNASDDLFRFVNIGNNTNASESALIPESDTVTDVSDNLFHFANPAALAPEPEKLELVVSAPTDTNAINENLEVTSEQVGSETSGDERVAFKPMMFRPIFYRCTSRCVTALTAVLLWKRFWSGSRPIADGFTVAAICLFAMAWFSYLGLDGLSFRHYLEERKKKRKPRAALDLTDFADQHIIRDEELLPRERTLCSLLASVLSGTIFLIVLVVSLLT